MIEFTLSFEGNDADGHELDFYDAAQAMIGFQRSLAITTHLVLNGKVITQAPALKNAQIMAAPPEEGSWKITALIATTLYGISTAPKDTPLGHLVHSAYDYIVSESLGFHVDYDKSLGQQYEHIRSGKSGTKLPILNQSQFDSAIEKCESALKDMHRPIVKSETASQAKIYFRSASAEVPFEHRLDRKSYEYITRTELDEKTSEIVGRVSSYNMNTFKGRIFVPEERRPIPFHLADNAKGTSSIVKIVRSLSLNATDRFVEGAELRCVVYKNRNTTGKLKGYSILEVRG
jgi:hypothetical protein